MMIVAVEVRSKNTAIPTTDSHSFCTNNSNVDGIRIRMMLSSIYLEKHYFDFFIASFHALLVSLVVTAILFSMLFCN